MLAVVLRGRAGRVFFSAMGGRAIADGAIVAYGEGLCVGGSRGVLCVCSIDLFSFHLKGQRGGI